MNPCSERDVGKLDHRLRQPTGGTLYRAVWRREVSLKTRVAGALLARFDHDG
jgi:hypothetical protein